ncbi:MAG: helix-turn-helix transcriptional regulator [Clostridia bacterium]|nr:helix-turn-helix transcriptional regulator [Clostridia bacterium]
MDDMTLLAKKIRAARKKLRQSQTEFAFNCDISVETLSLIEREETDPRLSTIQKIAAYLGTTVRELLSF